MVGTRRVHSPFTACFGFSKPMRKALARSISTNNASAKGSGTKCVAKGTVTSAAPKPVMPKTTEPAKAAAAQRGDFARVERHLSPLRREARRTAASAVQRFMLRSRST